MDLKKFYLEKYLAIKEASKFGPRIYSLARAIGFDAKDDLLAFEAYGDFLEQVYNFQDPELLALYFGSKAVDNKYEQVPLIFIQFPGNLFSVPILFLSKPEFFEFLVESVDQVPKSNDDPPGLYYAIRNGNLSLVKKVPVFHITRMFRTEEERVKMNLLGYALQRKKSKLFQELFLRLPNFEDFVCFGEETLFSKSLLMKNFGIFDFLLSKGLPLPRNLTVKTIKWGREDLFHEVLKRMPEFESDLPQLKQCLSEACFMNSKEEINAGRIRILRFLLAKIQLAAIRNLELQNELYGPDSNFFEGAFERALVSGHSYDFESFKLLIEHGVRMRKSKGPDHLEIRYLQSNSFRSVPAEKIQELQAFLDLKR